MIDTTPESVESVARFVARLELAAKQDDAEWARDRWGKAAAMLNALSIERDQARADLAEAVGLLEELAGGEECKKGCGCLICKAATFLAKHT